MTGAKDLVHNNEAALPNTAKPVKEIIDVEAKGSKLIKKTITNKLGERREVWVKSTEQYS